MWDFSVAGVTFYRIANYMILYSFLGWIWESCYVSVLEKKVVNRGFVAGPFCTIYGVGALCVYLILRPLEGKWVLLFVAGTLLATVLEYTTAAVMELLFHTSWWDYTNQKFNYKGRICLSSSLAWGGAALLLFAVIQPCMIYIVDLYPIKAGKIGVCIIGGIYCADFVMAVIAAVDVSKQLEKMDNLLEELAEYLKKSRVYATGEELFGRVEEFRKQVQGFDLYKRYFKRQEIKQVIWNERLEKLGLNDVKDEILDKLKWFSESFDLLAGKNHIWQNRILNAYPHLKSKARITKDRLAQKLTRHTKKEQKAADSEKL